MAEPFLTLRPPMDPIDPNGPWVVEPIFLACPHICEHRTNLNAPHILLQNCFIWPKAGGSRVYHHLASPTTHPKCFDGCPGKVKTKTKTVVASFAQAVRATILWSKACHSKNYLNATEKAWLDKVNRREKIETSQWRQLWTVAPTLPDLIPSLYTDGGIGPSSDKLQYQDLPTHLSSAMRPFDLNAALTGNPAMPNSSVPGTGPVILCSAFQTMDTPLQSLSRPNQITLPHKQKRKRDVSRDSDSRSAQDTETDSSDNESSLKVKPANSKRLLGVRPSDRVVPIASQSAGSSKHSRVESGVADDVSKGRVRGSSSSLRYLQSPATSTPPSAPVRIHKPVSFISQRQIVLSKSDSDDGDSVISVSHVKHTEDERTEYFKNQSEYSGSLAPNRVKSLTCPRTTEEKRKVILLADPDIQEVKTDWKVLCKKCNLWIYLFSGNGTEAYDLENWNQHKQSCDVPVPSSTASTTERRLKLVNDPQVISFGINVVVCAGCDSLVKLTKDMDYNLTLWEEHKAGCPENGSKVGSKPFSTKAPPSAGSTARVVSPERPALKGIKRRLEDEEAELPENDPDVRPQIQPRTEDYVAPDKEAPSVLGWFMMPLKLFLRGFNENASKGALTPIPDTP